MNLIDASGRSHRDAPVLRFDPTREELAALLHGEPRYRLDQAWTGLHERGDNIDDLTNLPKALRQRISEELPLGLTPEEESVSDDGETVKWLWRLHDGHHIETVLMHYEDRTTVCVSSQAGCAMACSFCATGQSGFDRHLSVGEIVEQVVRARRTSAPRRVSNIVFMGMGEPLANYDRMWAAVERINQDLGIGARHITISTVGVVPGIDRLAEENLPVNLAVSLHFANDEDRNELVPLNARYPLAMLEESCARYLDAKNRRLSFEWALIDGVNDRASDADELAILARRLRAHVNLIPLNPTPGYLTRGTPIDRVYEFRDRLTGMGVNATVRRTRGTEIDAACGQLRASRQLVDPPRRR
ncbi:MAG: 23S rRNA (adenine(2503)-C(2))-methyltransferase RlmN [Acidimicrobiaceae bacterium]|jgi:23S rRNA (adenine2503-C2)-methyltransferase|nr:23S rRNA (adenine(2503)-C(2))-methyltransferase RlmN [Acidimicrobiaceae bacterium]MBT5580902.1 23S rRNA (adenine(2503)-C(2))-methyltransferase RlmN [Acidimicrobiaceae bacterium]MBT5848884.1 23S rRNA (adenine(2503)-C(2))-methyltransferase RlmN [Acidimicrobiaceae bacterium]